MIGYFLYNTIFLPNFIAILYLLSLFLKRIRIAIKIRRQPIPINIPENTIKYWFHVASVGEYEQARIIAINIKNNNQKAYIIFSVFSDSAYYQRKEDWVHDLFFPIPFDFPKRIYNLLSQIQPHIIIYAKYDVWPNMAQQAFKLNIPQVLISALLPLKSKRQYPIISFFYNKVYKYLDVICTINDEHSMRFKKIGLQAVTVGDSRFDAIQYKIEEGRNTINNIFLQKYYKILKESNKKIIVAGSTYKKSEQFLIEFIKNNNNYFLILAPHHIDIKHINEIKTIINDNHLNYISLSEYKDTCLTSDINILLIDTVGILPFCYSIADICYVGGGWEGSVHSVIEPAYFGKSIITGPYINNSQEAIDLMQQKQLFIMQEPNIQEFTNHCISPKKESTKNILQYFNNKCGASEQIISIVDNLLHTKYNTINNNIDVF